MGTWVLACVRNVHMFAHVRVYACTHMRVASGNGCPHPH
jgi:hypothetical protein